MENRRRLANNPGVTVRVTKRGRDNNSEPRSPASPHRSSQVHPARRRGVTFAARAADCSRITVTSIREVEETLELPLASFSSLDYGVGCVPVEKVPLERLMKVKPGVSFLASLVDPTIPDDDRLYACWKFREHFALLYQDLTLVLYAKFNTSCFQDPLRAWSASSTVVWSPEWGPVLEEGFLGSQCTYRYYVPMSLQFVHGPLDLALVLLTNMCHQYVHHVSELTRVAVDRDGNYSKRCKVDKEEHDAAWLSKLEQSMRITGLGHYVSTMSPSCHWLVGGSLQAHVHYCDECDTLVISKESQSPHNCRCSVSAVDSCSFSAVDSCSVSAVDSCSVSAPE